MLLKNNASKTIVNSQRQTPHMVVGRRVDLAAAMQSETSQHSVHRTHDQATTSSAHHRQISASLLVDLLADEYVGTGPKPSRVKNTVSTSPPSVAVTAATKRMQQPSALLPSAARRVLRCAKLLRPIQDAWTCKICFEGRIDTVILPCGHVVACKACGERLADKPCPVCKQKISRVNLVYFPDA